jgi:P27 family predicted phage terminase small subunit
MRGRKPEPTHLKILKGNPGCRPLPRGEPMPPIPSVCPEPPEDLRGHALTQWHKVASDLFAMKLLSHVDTEALAMYCQWFGRWKTAEQELALEPSLVITRSSERGEITIANPLIGVAYKAALLVDRLGSNFGLTPAARARLAIDPPPKHGKFDGLIGPLPGRGA